MLSIGFAGKFDQYICWHVQQEKGPHHGRTTPQRSVDVAAQAPRRRLPEQLPRPGPLAPQRAPVHLLPLLGVLPLVRARGHHRPRPARPPRGRPVHLGAARPHDRRRPAALQAQRRHLHPADPAAPELGEPGGGGRQGQAAGAAPGATHPRRPQPSRARRARAGDAPGAGQADHPDLRRLRSAARGADPTRRR